MEMKCATIHYFSGTGNTFRAASIVKGMLEETGYSVEIHGIEKGLSGRPADLEIFAFPVYAYDVPEAMMRYIRALPAVQKRKAAVIAVHGMLWQKPVVPGDGGDPGYSFEHARRALTRKGYDVAQTVAVGYPHSITMLLSAPQPEEAAKIREASDRRVEAFADAVARGQKSLQPCGLFPAAYSLAPGIMFSVLGRRGLGKLCVADASCTGCGKCVASCPAGAIRLSLRRPRWGWKCQGCQRCINICPRKAIQVSLFRAGISAAGLFVPWNALAFRLFPVSIFSPHAGLSGAALDLAIWAIIYVLVFYALDKLLFVLEATPIVGKVLSLNLSSANRRYLDPVFRASLSQEAE